MAVSGDVPARQAPSWVLAAKGRPGGRARLLCIPYAGGAASAFRGWSDGLPADVEVCAVQLPGRGGRFREAPASALVELASRMGEGLLPLLDRPFALVGHSMGATLAFELVRELRRRGARAPQLLVVSGSRPPRRPEQDPPFSHLADADFLAEIRRRYDGIPAEVLAEKELLDLLLPVLRADIRMLESYRYAPGPPLHCPIVCLGGAEDHRVSQADLEAWGEETCAPVKVRTFRGGHFFIDSARAEVLQVLGQELAAVTQDAGVTA